jgi:2-polyprenyl-3-methyl-5-hydroxy-6-metoxy-1,4-benzoquinol methylase
MTLTDVFAQSRDKWREVPAGSETLGRIFAADLMALDNDALLERWHHMSRRAAAADDRGWFHRLYAGIFRGRNVIEVGSGLGIDGMHFLSQGARWTFCDIVPENLQVIRRVVDALGFSDRARFFPVDDCHAFSRLTERYDAVWAIGSLHHVPFDIARVQSLDLLRHLQPGGRWIELTYPYERWLREGAEPFSEFGKSTDGERTPWAEWYDLLKVKRRLFPVRTETVLDFTFGGGNFGWIDLCVEDGTRQAGAELAARSVGLGSPRLEAMHGTLVHQGKDIIIGCPPEPWSYCGSIDLRETVAALGPCAPEFGHALAVQVLVEKGSIGLLLTGENPDDFLGREQLVDASVQPRRVTLSTTRRDLPVAGLLIRNTAKGVASEARIHSAVMSFIT